MDLPTVVLVDTPSVDDVDQVLEEVMALVEEEQLGVYVHVQKRWTALVLGILDRFSGLGHFVWILNLVVVLILTGTISLLAIDESMEEVAIRRAEGATVGAVMLPVFLEGGLLAMLAMLDPEHQDPFLEEEEEVNWLPAMPCACINSLIL